MSIAVTPIPAIGSVATRPRKESLFDTEGQNNGVAIGAQLTLFQNFTTFATAGLAQTKTFGRDTNLTGAGGQLPKAHHFLWYGLRHKIRALTADLGLEANFGIGEEMNRIRELGSLQFIYGTTPYLITQLDEHPSGVGPQYVNIVGALAAGATAANAAFSLPNGVPVRSNYYDVSVVDKNTGMASPQEISEVESFKVQLDFAADTLPTPTVELYHTSVLVGVYLKGITG